MQKKSEFGRSMLETVMVMAIVCIISITGIYIYLQAMNGVRADGIVKDVLVRMAQEKSNKDLTKSSLGKRVYVPTYTKTTGQSESEKNTTKGRYGYSFEIIGNYSENALQEVEVRDGILTQSVCESLKKVLNNYQEKTFDEVLIGEVNILEENCPPEINSIRFRIGHPEKAKKVVMPTDISPIPTVVKTPDDCSLYPNSSMAGLPNQQIGTTGCYCTGSYFVSGNACALISCASYTGTSTTGTGGVAGKANDGQTDCKCPSGKLWGTNSCVCPSNQYLNGSTCTNCPTNATCNGQTFTCEQNYFVSGNACVAISCASYTGTSTTGTGGVAGKANDGQTDCKCPSGKNWTGSSCTTDCSAYPNSSATVREGQQIGTTGCYCNPGYEVEGNTCKAVVCTSTITASIENCQTQTTCTSPSGTFYTCTECETGYKLSENGTCVCDTATCNNGNYCDTNGVCQTCDPDYAAQTLCSGSASNYENGCPQVIIESCVAPTPLCDSENTCQACPTEGTEIVVANSGDCTKNCSNVIETDNGDGTYTCSYCASTSLCGSQCCEDGMPCIQGVCGCPKETPIWSTEQQNCVECISDGDCVAGLCISGICYPSIPCVTFSHLIDKLFCKDDVLCRKKCRNNSDCGGINSGYFCYILDDNSCSSGSGMCAKTTDFQIKATKTSHFGTLVSAIYRMNWWSAQNWCESQNLKMVNIDNNRLECLVAGVPPECEPNSSGKRYYCSSKCYYVPKYNYSRGFYNDLYTKSSAKYSELQSAKDSPGLTGWIDEFDSCSGYSFTDGWIEKSSKKNCYYAICESK